MISVSIIIPAYNAADTLAETLEPILAQTYPHWEAIVVDDGSTDETAEIAAAFVERDSRVRLIRQPNGNVCVARNTGIAAANYDWLLFNDSDDWIAPTHLEKMTAVLMADPELDGVHCGWSRVTSDGDSVAPKFGPELTDMFPELVRYCTFHVNTCIIRKTLVEQVGCFDVEVLSCEDWDLWQRIARMGAKFGAVREVLGFYRMRSNSRSGVSQRFSKAGLQVLTRGHQADPRVPQPHPDYALGLDSDKLLAHQFYFLNWSAGLVLGREQDARSLLDLLESGQPADLEAEWIAAGLFESVPIPSGQRQTDWPSIYGTVLPVMTDFLQALEQRSHVPNLAQQSLACLEHKILHQATAHFPLTLGRSHGMTIELTEPIPAVYSNVDRLHCHLTLHGYSFGELELPLSSQGLGAELLADAIAGEFFWPLLAHFFKHNIYAAGDFERHHEIGWERFLQELWQQPSWKSEQFYDAQFDETLSQTEPCIQVLHDRLCQIELSQDLPVLKLSSDQPIEFSESNQTISVILTLAGAALGVISVPVENQTVAVAVLRTHLLNATGAELCRVCVREAILGQPLRTEQGLRTRLQARTMQRGIGPIVPTSLPPIGSCWRPA